MFTICLLTMARESKKENTLKKDMKYTLLFDTLHIVTCVGFYVVFGG